MKHKVFIYTSLVFFVLLLGPRASVSEERLTKSLGLKVKTIYLDPWYGGREKGPLFAQKQYGKDITLKIAQRLQGLLEADGFTVHLSRTGDQFVSLDHRSFQAKSKGADIHLTINVSQRKKDCIRIVIFQPKQKEPQPKSEAPNAKNLNDLKADLDKIVKDLEVESRYEDSLALAGKISKKLKDGQVIICVRLLKGSDYILTNAEMPAVTIDFGVSSASKQQPYILDETSLDKITRSLAESIKEYVNDHAPQPAPQ